MGGDRAVAITALGISAEEPVDVEFVKRAIVYHQKHYDTAEPPGKFVALCNLGLARSKTGELDAARACHEEALDLAERMQSDHGKSIAMGNLALIEASLEQFEAARVNMQKHLSMSRDLQNWSAESLAYTKLAELAARSGDHAQANAYYAQARRIASDAHEDNIKKIIDCKLGVVNGNMRINQYMQDLMARAGNS